MRTIMFLFPLAFLGCSCVTPAAPKKVVSCMEVLERWVAVNGAPMAAQAMPDGGFIVGTQKTLDEMSFLVVVSEGQVGVVDKGLREDSVTKGTCEHPQSKYIYRTREFVKKTPGQPV